MRTVIEDVLDGVVDENDPAAASGPSNLTMWRWRKDRDKKDCDKKDRDKKDRDKKDFDKKDCDKKDFDKIQNE